MRIKNILKKFGTPLYVYEEGKIIENYSLIKNAITFDKKAIHYAVMCNNRVEILKILKKIGTFVQVSSLYELELAKIAGFTNKEISFTSIGLEVETLQKLIEENIQVNLDSLEEIEKYCKLTSDNKFGIRIKMDENIEIPEESINSPKDSEVGISKNDFNKVINFAKDYNCKINGIHGYLASNILSSKPFIDSSNFIIKYAKVFPDLEYVNFGSGFGVPDKETDTKFDFNKIGEYYSKLTQEISRYFGRQIELKIEPGRSLLATAGSLYAKVTNVKQIKGKKQIVINAGFAEFSRPRIYGAYHDIKVLGKEGNEGLCDIRANSVLQSDFFGKNRMLPHVREGNILEVRNVGAYGSVMASGFPGKRKPREIIVYMSEETKEI